ncbi:MocR-like transcription factor YczR [Sphaerimonospora thailandensis]|uniref:GntR family transcriptional regulator n=1 Tax=Sphaerimonospora thailandensis TaxID=795644 RepID=A0A8J3RCM3_9ACTN|nr:PLP-dependent aminotransferase family protein [Sphaerimonospora thailandensis]GIH70078.1 GntR family transcriptional regulator [Sphaerimonospora thailandensis]
MDRYVANRYVTETQLARLVRVPADARPYYRALAEAVRNLILDGRLPVRVRVPPERRLADALGVSRTTVTTAYDRLREQGYLESRQGAGSWTALPDAGSLGTDNLWIAPDDDGLLPLHVAAPPATALLGDAVAEAGRTYHRYALGMGYDPLGVAALREAVARRYRERGLPTRPDQIMITAGAQHATHLLLTMLAGPGDPVLLESPTYPHAIEAVRLRGARLVPVGIPEDGRHVDLMISAMRQSAARLGYLIPDFQNPTGHLMSGEDRAALVAAARRQGATLLTDESWVELALEEGEGAPPLAAFDTDDRVISIGSGSKLWWGGLRVGWIRAAPGLLRRLAVLRSVVDIAGPVFEQLVAAQLFDRIEDARGERRRTLGASLSALVAALNAELPAWTFTVPRGGGSLWIRLGAPVAGAVADAAASRGVRLAPGPWFGVDGTLERYLRLPFTQPPDVLREAVRRIATGQPGAFHPREPLIHAL